ncbi:hypothetical protein [Bradyrhizobium sp. RT6a]
MVSVAVSCRDTSSHNAAALHLLHVRCNC